MVRVDNSTPGEVNQRVRIGNASPEQPSEDLVMAFVAFLHQHVAAGPISPHTIRAYQGEAGRFLAWCRQEQVDPATATPAQLAAYSAHLHRARYAPATIALKLAAVVRFYEAIICGPGRRADNPAAGLTRPKLPAAAPGTALAPEQRRRLLDAPRLVERPASKRQKAIRDRAILGLLIEHGLRGAQVAALQADDLDLATGILRVRGRRSMRFVALGPVTRERLAAWDALRPLLAQPGETALFVSTHAGGRTRRPAGTALDVRAIRNLVDCYLRATELKRPGVSADSLRRGETPGAEGGS